MPPLDTQTWITAARRYMRLRRRHWRCLLGGFGLFAVLGTPLFAFEERLHPVLFTGFLACWLGGFTSWLALFSFRCPRCGNQFVVSWTSTTWPSNHCKHCRLDLRAAAMANYGA